MSLKKEIAVLENNSIKQNSKSTDYFTKDDIDKSYENLTQSHSDTEFEHKRDLDMNKNNDSKVLSSKSRECWRDKGLVTTSYLCIILYTCSKNANIIQMVIGYYTFAQNIFKRCVEVFNSLVLSVSSKTFCQLS